MGRGGIIGAIGGAALGIATGGLGFAAVGASALTSGAIGAGVGAGAGALYDSNSQRKPPALRNVNPLAPSLPPVNFMEIFDKVSEQRFKFIRGENGQEYLEFSQDGNRVPISAPIPVNNLPPVREIRGQQLDLQEAGIMIALSEALNRVATTIETISAQNPMLVEQNREFIDSFRNAQQRSMNRGFDIGQQGFDVRLKKMGINESSTSLGVQVALARERAEVASKADLQLAELAMSAKNQTLENMQRVAGTYAGAAQYELGRHQTNTTNQLNLRGQDIQAQAQTQQLEQARAFNQEQLNINAEAQRRELILQRNFPAFAYSTLNGANSNAVGAAGVDASATANFNTANIARYQATPINPMLATANTLVGTGANYMAGNLLTDRSGISMNEHQRLLVNPQGRNNG